MAKIAAELLIERLGDWRVDTVFGSPGDGINGITEALRRHQDKIRFVLVHHEVSTEAFYETDPTKPYERGFAIQCIGPLPITWAEHVVAEGHWGDVLREYMRDYVHWATIRVLCEFLPQPENRVTLADERDRHGLPVARFSYTQCDNDKALLEAGRKQDAGDPGRGRRRGRRHHRAVRPSGGRSPHGC